MVDINNSIDAELAEMKFLLKSLRQEVSELKAMTRQHAGTFVCPPVYHKFTGVYLGGGVGACGGGTERNSNDRGPV